MKAIALTGIRQMAVQECNTPAIEKETDVLLKIKQVGVCGSDVHYYEDGRIGDQVIEYPFVVGHECSATVEAVGAGVSRIKMGDRVAVDPAMPCFACDQCRAGREHTCRHLRFLGCPGQAAGSLSDYIVMPETSCFVLNDNVNFTQGVLSEPLAISIYATQQAALTPGMTVGILGSGPIGLSCLISAQAQGAEVSVMTDLVNERLSVARAQGAIWTGNPQQQNIVKESVEVTRGGVDVVFECAGQQETVDQALDILTPGGKLLLIGIPRVRQISFNIHKARRKEIALINIRRQNQCTQTALDWIAQGKVDVNFMQTHRFPADQTAQAFELVAGYADGVIKAFIDF